MKKIHVKEALVLLEECPLLRIEDLLPHLPDLAAIDDVRDRICHALVRYSDTIKVRVTICLESSSSVACDMGDVDRVEGASWLLAWADEPPKTLLNPLIKQTLKAEMAETSQSAAEAERALQQLQHRHLPFPAAQGCALCAAPALASQFYLFPCR